MFSEFHDKNLTIENKKSDYLKTFKKIQEISKKSTIFQEISQNFQKNQQIF